MADCRLAIGSSDAKPTLTTGSRGSIWDGHLGKWINDRRYHLYIQS
jgi:hypothetical protein